MRLLTTLFLICSLGISSQVQGQALETLDLLVSPGYTIGGRNYYPQVGFGAPIILNVDFAVYELISLGVYGGMSRRKGIGENKFKAWNLGVRASFHLWNFLDYRIAPDLRSEEIDVYATLVAGYEKSNYDEVNPPSDVKATRWIAGPLIGARWYFMDQVAVFGEFGYGPWGFATIGVTAKLWVFQ